ncbi:MAG: NAD(P)H-dependent oxidoreductase subunit E [Planctomycetota bacterium]|jgi:NADH:ubiquinone oxidoreductase subunit F (NADH-binding)/NADH:ubiquinone oxidoreductase subunit E/NAD-dependent dihydropyrimidine dehydrogenase PreA subunit
MNEIDLQPVDAIVEQIGAKPSDALPLLQAVQEQFGYLPSEAIERLAEITECSMSGLWSIATFYDQFRLEPAGKHFVKVCIGTACHVKGATQIYEAFKRYLNIGPDDDTDAEKLFTVEKVACLGCCMLAPAVQIGDVIYGHLTGETVGQVLQDFLEQQKHTVAAPAGGRRKTGITGQVRICLDSSCRAVGSDKVYDALKRAVDDLDVPVKVKSTSCHGMSFLAPLVEVVMADGQIFRYGQAKPSDAISIIRRHFQPTGVSGRIKSHVGNLIDTLLDDRIGHGPIRYSLSIRDHSVDDYLNQQKQVATEHAARIDPLDIEEYEANGGFEALRKCLADRTPASVLTDIENSGLRGRGGGGYPTYLKWHAVQRASSNQKYIICNGDEGDPGAFMDRMLMESYPYRVLEGMAIAAWTVGANQGVLYIRSEYPLAIVRITEAIKTCKHRGYLGENILGGEFSFDLKVYAGAGAFVCGEETALIKSIEGKRPAPRLRPPYPTQSGLNQQPTLVNNVETYALVSWVLRNGPQAFSELGTSDSKGTKVFALAGKIRRGGLIEVPMGMTVRQIVDEIGGGIENDNPLKAVQIGGPSGGCVPASMADTPIDYESLHTAGAIMGSGGMVVLDESDCMVDIARYFLEFTQDQSCGRCTFCRVGTKRMLEILERLCAGQGQSGDIEKLQELGDLIQNTSICGLGKTAPNPVLSTIEHFRDEYESHIQGKCPAGKCRELIRYSINDDCIGCTLCSQHCPADAIAMKPYEKHIIDQTLCIRCDTCKQVCPAKAVEVV